MYTLTQGQYDSLGYDLATELAAFTEAKRVHAFTEGIAAPTAPALVETIYYRHDGEFQVKDPKWYYRVTDGIIVEKKAFLEPPDSHEPDLEWIEVTDQGQQMLGNIWSEKQQTFLPPAIHALIESVPVQESEPRTKEEEIADIRRQMLGLGSTFQNLQARLDQLEGGSE